MHKLTLLQLVRLEEKGRVASDERSLDETAIDGMLDTRLVVSKKNDDVSHFFSCIISA